VELTINGYPFVHVDVFWRGDDGLERPFDECGFDERLAEV
jgi:hypothetical protein